MRILSARRNGKLERLDQEVAVYLNGYPTSLGGDGVATVGVVVVVRDGDDEDGGEVGWRSHDSGDGGVDEGGVRVEPRWGEDLISVCVERVVAGISAGASGLGGREKYKGVRSVVCEAVIKELP
ncbi:hypothetical protein Tco_0053279 [Tanacetum coccineum]